MLLRAASAPCGASPCKAAPTCTPAVHCRGPAPNATLPAPPPHGQATSNGFGLVSAESVFRVCDQPHPKLIGAVVQHCMEARIDDAYEGMRVGEGWLACCWGPCGRQVGHGLMLRQSAAKATGMDKPPVCFPTWPCLTLGVARWVCPHPPAAPSAGCPQALCDMGYSASDIITTLFRVVRNFGGMNEYLKLEYIKVGRRGDEDWLGPRPGGGCGLHSAARVGGGWPGSGSSTCHAVPAYASLMRHSPQSPLLVGAADTYCRAPHPALCSKLGSRTCASATA